MQEIFITELDVSIVSEKAEFALKLLLKKEK